MKKRVRFITYDDYVVEGDSEEEILKKAKKEYYNSHLNELYDNIEINGVIS